MHDTSVAVTVEMSAGTDGCWLRGGDDEPVWTPIPRSTHDHHCDRFPANAYRGSTSPDALGHETGSIGVSDHAGRDGVVGASVDQVERSDQPPA